jgi:uncharacterized protein (UPF0335 family)
VSNKATMTMGVNGGEEVVITDDTLARIGHNSKKAKVGGLNNDQLVSIVERIEKLTEEKKSIGEDIKDVFTEAKGNGFDNATIREMLKLRAMGKADRDEREALRDTYALALGVFA